MSEMTVISKYQRLAKSGSLLRNSLFLSILCLLVFTACKRNPFDIDVSKINYSLEIHRFEKDLFETEPVDLQDSISLWITKYGDFLDAYSRNIIMSGNPRDSLFLFHLFRFRTDKDIQLLYKHTMEVFPDLNSFSPQLEKAFKHYLYYFPDFEIPRIYTCVSGFNFPLMQTDSSLAICLDLYLGHEFELYKYLGIPRYQMRRFNPEHIVPDALKALIYNRNPYNFKTNDFLSQMIYHGKILYFLDALIPDVHDSLKTGFTHTQLEWCKTNEANMWAYYLDNKMLYSTNIVENNKFLNPAPFTAVFSRESPGEAALWTGWQIVKTFMQRNEDYSMPQLMELKDAHLIFNKSKYKPRR